MSARSGAEDGRVIVGLWHATLDVAAMHEAAELARLLSVGLYGLFIEDESLLAMAALPFAREIGLTTHTWRPLSADAVESEMRAAAHEARRQLDRAARARGIVSAFEVVRGDPAACITAACRAGDILVVAQQSSAGVRAAQDAWRLREAAEEAACSILLLPTRRAPAHGHIVAVLADENDHAFETACALAAATGEDLVLLLGEDAAPQAAAALPARARAAGLVSQRITARPIGASGFDTMADLRPRLVVVARASPLAEATSRSAAAHALPVLLLGEPAAR